MNEQLIKTNAAEFARKNRRQIARKLTDLKTFPPDGIPVSVFMAGSPGAGKTEFSKNIISILEDKNLHPVIRIDSDDIRPLLPGYTGSNSYLFQGVVSLIVEKIHDYVLAQKQSFVLDGTFSRYEKASANVQRSLDKGRPVFIFYLYQSPLVAWHFTQKREKIEGRNIPKAAFIEQFFGALDTVIRLRQEYGDEVKMFLVKKNFEKNTVEKQIELKSNSPTIDEYVGERYTQSALEELL